MMLPSFERARSTRSSRVGLEDRSFAQVEVARLEELRLAALEFRIEADLALGAHTEQIGELEALVRQHPLRERLRAQLMLVLYRSEHQAEALALYAATRRTLVEELGGMCLSPCEPVLGLEPKQLAGARDGGTDALVRRGAAEGPQRGGPIVGIVCSQTARWGTGGGTCRRRDE
jgi:hypothetical protein